MPAQPAFRRSVLLTQGRSAHALAWARQLSAHGHRVFAIDTLRHTVCRYSRAVYSHACVASPRLQPETFVAEVQQIVTREGIDAVIPIFEEGLYLAQHPALARLLFAPAYPLWAALHDKYRFAKLSFAAGLPVPATIRLRHPDELASLDPRVTYAIKPCRSAAALDLHRWRPGTAAPKLVFDAANPFVAQPWLLGKRLCAFGICLRGCLSALAVYAVDYTLDGHSCVAFAHSPHPGIEAWMRTFVAHYGVTGQLGCDFIEDDAGRAHAIECNPRATSGVHLFAGTDALSRALCGTPGPNRRGSTRTQRAPTGRRQQVAIGMAMALWRRLWPPRRSVGRYFRALCTTPDVIFARDDKWPFFAQPLAFAALLRQTWRLKRQLAASFLFDFTFVPGVRAPATRRPVRLPA